MKLKKSHRLAIVALLLTFVGTVILGCSDRIPPDRAPQPKPINQTQAPQPGR